MYLLRFDDASEYMDTDKWERVEKLVVKYDIKPIVGVIPKNEDPSFISAYQFNNNFWELVERWKQYQWCIAMHGYNHVYSTASGGINPINKRSEFASVDIEIQKDKIKKGVEILQRHNIDPKVFFAPAHTFDESTLHALKTESNIQIISDTIAGNVYYDKGYYFIPQQVGSVRSIPLLSLVTFCYHPNTMTEKDFNRLEKFLRRNKHHFVSIENIELKKRTFSIMDMILRKIYFTIRHFRCAICK